MKVHKKLSAYSTAAFGFLALYNDISAQVIYTNIDPDENLGLSGQLQLDINDDGVIDIGLDAYLAQWSSYSYWQGWSTFTAGEYFYASNFSAVVGTPSNPNLAANLQPGDIIGASAIWNTNNEINFAGLNLNTYSYVEIIEGWNKQNNYIGFKFQADGQTHYGWVRLSIDNLSNNVAELPKLIIQDYAYEATPNTPITIEHVAASIAENLVLKDIGETSTANDLQLTFNKAADESFVSEYRVFLHRIPDAIYNSLDALLGLPADRYISIIPDGTNHVINFDATTLDTDGNPIASNSTYEARVVSMPDGIQTNIANVAVVSNKEEIIIRSTGEAQLIAILKNGSTGTSSDFKVTFKNPSIEYGIAAFRVYIIKYGLNVDYDTLINLDENYFVEIPYSTESNYVVPLPPEIKTIGDDGPIIFESYTAAVLTIPDSIAATTGELNFSKHSLAVSSPLYPEMPVVLLDDTTKTPHDILVNFPMSPVEEKINDYKIILVPAEDTATFTVEDVLDLSANNYYQVMPVGADINTHLPSFLNDSHGYTPNPETIYVVYVALTSVYYSSNVSLSFPSIPFTLKDGKVEGVPVLTFYNNAIYYNVPANEVQNILLFDIGGRKIAEWAVSGSGIINNFDGIAPGIYFLQYNNADVIKIFIDKQ